VYGPAAFTRSLAASEILFASLKGKTDNEKRRLLMDHYSSLNNKISLAWLADVTKLWGQETGGSQCSGKRKGGALSIMPLAVSKAVYRGFVLRSMTAGSEALGRITDEETWNKIAEMHKADAVLDDQSVSLIKKQNPNLSCEEMTNLLNKFQNSVALDTVRKRVQDAYSVARHG
jgi:hypothetical protein